MSKQPLSVNLDDLLLDIATAIEPSDADRRIVGRRYRQLKEHLERPSSPLAPYMRDDESRIYAQGSVAISATIISGDKDDRFDVDAIVEFDVPSGWSNDKALDLLFEALQGFPGAKKIVRNTRCVRVEFASMHMDVTPMDPEIEPRIDRVGEIFHSPDEGEAYRVPSNSFGFAQWFRGSVVFQQGVGSFAERVAARRALNAFDRLQAPTPRSADQDDLPPMIPPRLDAQQVVALKLMKRFLNIAYQSRSVRRPPSIYFTKLSADCGFEPNGLTAQLERFAGYVQNEMAGAMAVASGPDERNPTYPEDRINDRWPNTQEDRRVLHSIMGDLLTILRSARRATFAEIAFLLSGVFGEAISGRAVEKHLKRREGVSSPIYIKGTGTVVPAAALAGPAIARETRRIPDHHFHCEDPLYDRRDDEEK
ncbi:MAG: nucleotidyltransferase [Rhizobiaceae bacterium]